MSRRTVPALLILLATAAPASACPLCRDGTVVTAAPTTGPTAPAEAASVDFNASVYAMLGVVAVVAAATGRAMVKAVRG